MYVVTWAWQLLWVSGFCLLCGGVRVVALFVFVFVPVWFRLRLEVLWVFGLVFVCLVVGGLCLFWLFCWWVLKLWIYVNSVGMVCFFGVMCKFIWLL